MGCALPKARATQSSQEVGQRSFCQLLGKQEGSQMDLGIYYKEELSSVGLAVSSWGNEAKERGSLLKPA